jgi:large subunit ribosomal protein L24e
MWDFNVFRRVAKDQKKAKLNEKKAKSAPAKPAPKSKPSKVTQKQAPRVGGKR